MYQSADARRYNGLGGGYMPQSYQETWSQLERRIYEEMEAFEYNHWRFFQPHTRVWRENWDYYLGYHWSTDDMKVQLELGRKPYYFNLIQNTVDGIKGELYGQRTDPQVAHKNKFSEQYADAGNHYLRWVMEENDWQDTHIDVAMDGIVGGVGFVGVAQSPFAPTSDIDINHYYAPEFMWDINSAHNSKLENVQYFERVWNTSADDAARRYPDAADSIRRNAGNMGRYLYGLETLSRPKVHPMANELQGYYIWQPITPYTMNQVLMREFFVRRYEQRWVVFDGVTGTKEPKASEQEAADWYNWLIRYYMNPSIQELYGIYQPNVSQPTMESWCYVDKYVFAGTALVDVSVTTNGNIPYKPFIPRFVHGDLTSYTEDLKPPQRFINRIVSFLDEQAGGTKGGTLVNDARIKGITPDQVDEKLRGSNWILHVQDEANEFNFDTVLKKHEPQGSDQRTAALLNVVNTNFMQMIGGANAQGFTAFSGQSGESAKTLINQASLRHIPLFGKDRVFQRTVFEDALTFLPLIDKAVQMTVTENFGDEAPMTLALNDFKVTNAHDLSFVVWLSEKPSTPSERDADLNRIAFVMQTMGEENSGDLLPLLIDDLPLQAKERRALLAGRDKRLKRQQDIEDRTFAAEQEQVQFDRSVQQAKLMLEEKKLNIEELKVTTAKFNFTDKVSDMPEGLLSTFMNASGIPMTPEYAIGDKARNALVVKQPIANLQQESFNKREGAFIRSLPKDDQRQGKRAKKGTATPKDSKARKNR
jgi:hypothetical protein